MNYIFLFYPKPTLISWFLYKFMLLKINDVYGLLQLGFIQIQLKKMLNFNAY